MKHVKDWHKLDTACSTRRDGRPWKRPVTDDEKPVPEVEILWSFPQHVEGGKAAGAETRPLAESEEGPETKGAKLEIGEGHAQEEEPKDEEPKDEEPKEDEVKDDDDKHDEVKDDGGKDDTGDEDDWETVEEETKDEDPEDPKDPKEPEDAKDSEDGTEDESEDSDSGSASGVDGTDNLRTVEGEHDEELRPYYDEDIPETDDDIPEDSPLSPGKTRAKRVVVLGNPSDRRSAWYFIDETGDILAIDIDTAPSPHRLRETQRVVGLSRETFISQRVLALFATTSKDEDGKITLPAYLHRAAVGCKRCQALRHACYPQLVVANGRVTWENGSCLECSAETVKCEWDEVVCQAEVMSKDGGVEMTPSTLDPHVIVEVVASTAS
ncbi:uncharacterized protein LOC62_07G009509 [Vanrija pseudolonga]|uniref:Uncharacterized protein n=1 Tax=Vanrija pseudolonga TaxID=143232 RepID=A0AAF1BLK9_9TREE|nr:hypothetical protein LOC62_07G009509 [Vanrija pseudolonga]